MSSRGNEAALQRTLDLRAELRAGLKQAQALRLALESARAATENSLTASNRTDPLKAVTGKSSLELAVETTDTMIERLTNVLATANVETETKPVVATDAWTPEPTVSRATAMFQLTDARAVSA